MARTKDQVKADSGQSVGAQSAITSVVTDTAYIKAKQYDVEQESANNRTPECV